jgi:glucokinase
MRVVVVEDGAIVYGEKRPRHPSPELAVAQLAEFKAGYEDRTGSTVTALGIGCAGLIRTDGVVARSPNVPEFDGFPLGAALRAALAVPVAVENDATAALWAETQSGAAVGRRDVLYTALGTGIGGGIALDGQVRRGAHGFAAEIGHMVVAEGGPLCTCGRQGCWEVFASGRALGRFAREAVDSGQATRILELAGGQRDAIMGEHVTAALVEGDSDARAVLDRLGRWFGIGAANLVLTLDPEMIVLGGGLEAIGSPLVEVCEAGLEAALVDRAHRGKLPMELVHHDSDGGALGAALLASELV